MKGSFVIAQLRYAFSPNSLRNKMILLACGISLITAAVVSWMDYKQAERVAIESHLRDLRTEARLIALHFDEAFGDMLEDAQVISKTPPIQGLIRSRANGGVDPADQSTDEQWRSRMEAIFESILVVRPSYTQIRYIGLENNGRELVRVNRGEHEIVRVASDNLQEKKSEPYFIQGAFAPKDQFAFSQVGYNREFDEIDAALVPTVRAIIPVFSDDDERYGMVVINANYEALLKQWLSRVESTHEITVLDDAGDYMILDPGGNVAQVSLATSPSYALPANLTGVLSLPSGATLNTPDSFLTYLRFPILSGETGLHLSVILRSDRRTELAATSDSRKQSVLVAALLVLGSLAAATFFAGRTMRPLEKMNQAIKAYGPENNRLDLPADSSDEIGELARSFSALVLGLEDSQEKVRTIIDSVIDPLIVIDERGIIDTYNPACEKIFGYSVAEAVGKNVNMLMPSPQRDEHDGYLASYRNTGVKKIIGIGREVIGQRKDGTVFPADLSISEIHLDGSRLFCGIIRDISDRKQMEVMKDEFVSTVNHELRTPLSSIYGSLSLLRARTKDQIDEKSSRLLELAHNGCERLSSLVNDILDIEKIAAGKMEYRFEALDLHELVADVIAGHEALAEKYAVTFRQILDGPNVQVEVDPNRFNQSLVNLISNACKYSPPGDEVLIEVRLDSPDWVRISVKDNGPGIPASFRDKIFERFAQADGSEKGKGGSGLGLNITKTLIEAFGGSVSFESVENEGTMFSIVLPVHHSETTTKEVEPCLAN